jgi:hypothetical protein
MARKNRINRGLDEASPSYKDRPPKADKTADAERRRAAVLSFMDARNLKAKTWAKSAGLSPGVLLNFLNKHSNSLNQRTIEKLAAQQEVTVAEILGEVVPSPVPGKDLVALHYVVVTPVRGGSGQIVVKTTSRHAQYFTKGLLERISGGKPARLGLYEITGDDMSPSLNRGDIAVINLEETDVARTPGVYCFWDGHGVLVKRLAKTPGASNAIRIQSDNAQYPAETIDAAEVQVIGRVVFRSGLF